ncbi:MAG: XRE family transcriptional regulator [Candidatus Aminicenantes bacterium]|nr:MAG: XRE family transcriptional regulator [Candidatus Aminicenantes bacterium]
MNKVRHFREKQNFRQIDLARKANISMTWLWALENGFDERVSKKIKERVSLALECKYEELFSG